MNRDDLITEMLNPAGRREAALSRAVTRSREAKTNGGEPDAAWSMGEKLLNALVLEREDQLAALDYTKRDAIERVRWDFGATEDEFPAVLEQIRNGL